MLFNSTDFILYFLPLVLLVYLLLCRWASLRVLMSWLVIASLFFYAYWNPVYLLLILASILFNYYWAALMRRYGGYASLLGIGVAINLGALGYFKYAGFLVATGVELFGTDWQIPAIALPLAISFFTFQQIGFLVDTHRGKVGRTGFLDYCLFVTFFPQLIAGPIVHHADVMPQFAGAFVKRAWLNNFAVGGSLFIIGLAKKVGIADQLAVYADAFFSRAAAGGDISCMDTWLGSAAYTLQIYFDFSGYSDMAIGLARMFGIVLPINFDSPLKALSIAEYWNRWHMTLSRFLREYVYFSLGGARRGNRSLNLFITMFLGGIWHGAAMTYVVWGAMHGMFLVVNHWWRSFRIGRLGQTEVLQSRPGRLLAFILTFACLLVGFVMFRADSLHTALYIYKHMFNPQSIAYSDSLLADFHSWSWWPELARHSDWAKFLDQFKLVIVALLIALFAPNSQRMFPPDSVIESFSVAQALLITALLVGLLALINQAEESAFIYFIF